MIIDAHQHFIQFRPGDYPWISADMEGLRRDRLPGELLEITAKNGVEATVAVEARQNLQETEWLLGLADHNPLIAGVVGWVDLCDPLVEGLLEPYADNEALKGVRHVLHDEPDDDYMLRPDFLHGIGVLGSFGLTYDILIFPRHLPQTLELVRHFPDQPFVIDHIAKPAIRDGEIVRWKDALRPIAGCSNVSCKLSGMVTEARPGAWSAADFLPYIETVVELFGPERVMFGSDWPVCTLEADYETVLEIVQQAVSPMSTAEQEMIFAETAREFYGLSV